MLNNTLLESLLSMDLSDRCNAILDLAEKRDIETYYIILYLIKKAELNREPFGTLVYALKNYPAENLFLQAIKWVAFGGFEVSHEAFEIINSIDKINGDEAEEAYLIIKNRMGDNIEDWREELLKDILEMFD